MEWEESRGSVVGWSLIKRGQYRDQAIVSQPWLGMSREDMAQTATSTRKNPNSHRKASRVGSSVV